MTSKSSFIRNASVLGTIGGLFFAATIAAAWNSAPPTPPSGNVDAPINVSANPQIKAGGIWASSLGLDGGMVAGTTIAAGTGITVDNNGITLLGPNGGVTAAGTITTPRYCLQSASSGLECLQDWPWFINIATRAIYANNDARKVGMGTATPDTELEVVNNEFNTTHGITNTQYSDSVNAAQFNLNKARGTKDTPAAVQALDKLGNIRAKGWDGSQFDVAATITFKAERNFTSSDNGTAIYFTTAAPGTPGGVEPPERMRITGSGNVGIGTANPATKLQVLGNIRVGTSGSNGCVQNFNNTSFWGSACSSDARLKTVTGNVSNVLEGISHLNLITYHWNDVAAAIYQDDTSPTATGFVAQDVQKQFPELVTTDDHGYYQLDYSRLGLYTTQAVKELSQKVDRQQQEIDALKAEIETLTK